GPACGALFGGTCGAIAGELARPRKWKKTIATLLALAGPLGGAAISVWRFYSSPMIFAFDPFVGYFSGTLYDTVIDAGPALLTYRLGSLCTLAALALGASAWDPTPQPPPRERAGVARDPGARARLALGACAAIASLAITIEG